MTEMHWKEYNGIDVTVDGDGIFRATVNGVFLNAGCWEHLRTKIEQEKKADAKSVKLELDCVVLLGNDDMDYSAQRTTITGLSRTDSSFKFRDGIESKYVQYVLPYTPKNASLLEELATAKSTARDILASIRDRTLYNDRWGGRIEPTKYPEKLINLKERYDTCLKGAA
jgi:hypothetical protein